MSADVIDLRQKKTVVRNFRKGQLWEPRKPDHTLGPDYWRIEVITDHPESPVIARHTCGVIRAYGRDGSFEGAGDTTDLDLVTLIEECGPPDLEWPV